MSPVLPSNPHGTCSTRRFEIEAAITDDLARTHYVKFNASINERSRRTVLVNSPEHNSSYVDTIPDDLVIVGLDLEVIPSVVAENRR